jgi:cell wall-associated NlpC family hydrolase
MKKAIIAAGAALVLGLSGAAIASEPLQEPIHSSPKVELTKLNLIPEVTTLTKLEQEAQAFQAMAAAAAITSARQDQLQLAYSTQLANNQVELESVVSQLIERVGKTPYVFAGSHPSGWDCSGMVVWAYKKLGIDLPHSASEQAKLGLEVLTPQVGDIVVYGDASGYFHSAIYVGDGLLVHSGFKPGRWTELIPMNHGSLANLNYTIRRFLDTE